MKRTLAFLSTLLILTLSTIVICQERNRRVDDPDDEEDLNRELWEFAKGTSYESILPYVAAEQRKSQAALISEVELPNGWKIAPAGLQAEVGRLPYAAVMFAGKLVVLNTGYYYKEPQEVSIVNPKTAEVEQTLKFQSLFPSAVVGLDGDLYISGGFDNKIYRVNEKFNIVREYPLGGFTGGLAAIDSDRLAVVTMATKMPAGNYVGGKLGILNTKTGTIEREADAGYFPFGVRSINGRLYVVVLGENKVLVFSPQLNLIKSIDVGRTPQQMCTDGNDLYVVNTGSDSLSVIDTRTNRRASTISLASRKTSFGAAPTSCAVSSNRIYVTLADTNAVAVLDKRNHKQIAAVPAGWYPTGVLAEGNQLFVLNAKGIRARRPNVNGPKGGGPSRVAEYVLNLLRGSVSIIAKSDVETRGRNWSQQVEKSPPTFDSRQVLKLPIRYIFYIIKENRTYDQVLGDLKRGNGDPKLALFDESVTPMHHQLAKEFVTLDNFFCNGEISVLGHSFTTSGYASAFIEWFGNVTYSSRWKGYPYGMVPAMTSPQYLWDILDEKNVDYKIYGENYFLFTRAYRILTELYGPEGELTKKYYAKTIAASAGEDRGTEFNEMAKVYSDRAKTREDAYKLLGDVGFVARLSLFLTGDYSFADAIKRDNRLRRRFADYLYHYPFNFRSWDLNYSDLDRVRVWKDDFETQLKLGQVAQLHYIWLPNDHTDGSSKKILDAFQFVAQNDTALGRVVEAISHSPIWKESLILVEEDDAQNGPDHVDATRTIAFAAGPYVKRDAVVKDRYDQLSMLRTIEILLGLKPLNLTDAMAVPMFGVFTNQPNFQPFVAVPPSSRLAEADRERDRALMGR
jgi:YVTN family beta-propeller protein